MAESESVPVAVMRLLKARYPTLDIDPTWLRACVQELRRRDESLQTGSPDQLARAVKQRLLDSDLAQVVRPSYVQVLPDVLRSSSGMIGDVGRGAILVQIESMIDIGYSVASQLEIAEARSEARRANVDPNHVPAEVNASQAAAALGSDHMAEFQTQEDDMKHATTIYPRRMLMLELSDGSKRPNVLAIELQRIAGIDMNTTMIGTKLLLKGVHFKHGYLLLTPQSVTVEGGGVKQKDQVAEDRLIDKLRAQLGKASPDDKTARMSRRASVANTAAPPSEMAAATAACRFSPDVDEDELVAALEAEEEMAESANPARASVLDASNVIRTELAGTEGHYTPTSSRQLPTRKRALLIVPEGMAQSSSSKPRSQQTSALVRPNATQEDPIWLSDNDDDALFGSLPDTVLGTVDIDRHSEPVGDAERPDSKPSASASFSNTRNEPIVIGSSPEP